MSSLPSHRNRNTKFFNARAELLFCQLGLLFFQVLVAVATAWRLPCQSYSVTLHEEWTARFITQPGICKLRAQSRMLFCACYHCFPCAYVMVRFDPAIQLVAQTKSCTLYVRTYSHTLPNFSAGLVTTIFVNMGLRCVHFA